MEILKCRKELDPGSNAMGNATQNTMIPVNALLEIMVVLSPLW